MAITAISTASFLGDSVIYIRDDLLNNGPTDPISSTRISSEKFVMTSYSKRNVTYPIITVKDRGTNVIQRGGMQSSVTINRMSIEIRVWARNIKERDELSQNVMDRLRSIQHTATTGTVAVGLFDFLITSVLNIEPLVGEQTNKSKLIIIEYLIVLGE